MNVSLYGPDCDEAEAEAAFDDMESKDAPVIGIAVWGNDMLISTTFDLAATEEVLATAYAAIRQRRAN